jgi:hypothetical protein
MTQWEEYIFFMKLNTPKQEGGYCGVPVKEIAKREGISIYEAYLFINNTYMKKRQKDDD